MSPERQRSGPVRRLWHGHATMCGMSQLPSGRSTAPRAARPDASMSLLTNAMEHSLDDGYAEAAARRGLEGRAGLPRTLRAKLGLAGGLLLAALVVTVGAAQARVDAPTLAKERQELIDRVHSRTADTDKLQEQVDSLRDTVHTMQNKALEHAGGGGQDATALLAAATPVHGPGLQLVINDAEDTTRGDGGGPRESTDFSDTGRVRDRDMQRVVNGLWASGAEAVSINGERLTALSAIRAAGEAILVDNKPLVAALHRAGHRRRQHTSPTRSSAAWTAATWTYSTRTTAFATPSQPRTRSSCRRLPVCSSASHSP